ncbi:spore germination protein [Paenibacillus sp. 1001270B_150601_E10]|uniref:spore germination protein n=1 Tax=Paenibacillus sp. 1001270B_150601_E10 TaxID=2787079 RepID=UPI0018A0BFE6|nr:spore germination protein [Paenibacillus sp. 1001270B_150601_E10]
MVSQQKLVPISKQVKNLDELIHFLMGSSDYYHFSPINNENYVEISYYRTLVNQEKVNQFIIPVFQYVEDKIPDMKEVMNHIPFNDIELTTDLELIEKKLTGGYIMIRLRKHVSQVLMVNVRDSKSGYRQSNETDNEFSVIGPKIGFVENLDTNVGLIRHKLTDSRLVLKEMTIGNMSKTRVVLLYLEGVTNPDYVNTAMQRLNDFDMDVVFDSSLVDQIISDNSNSPFPQFLSTERVDRVTFAIINGQIAIMADGSPYVFTAPTTLTDFFISPEDYFMPWVVGSFFRLIRLIGVIFTLFASALYVALMTYHFEVIPDGLIGPLISSRAFVPFTPLLEVIFLELTIEVLREAGARLPTKIGSTLGVVGGIVIGQAAVEAALTSNILLIFVALSALTSFTTPIFKMSNTVRLLRFPIIFAAAIWGGFGMVFMFILLLGHLMKLESLGSPYLAPFYPVRASNWTDTVIRPSYRFTSKRNGILRPLQNTRYIPKSRGEQDHDD